jgi:hypothetical protein
MRSVSISGGKVRFSVRISLPNELHGNFCFVNSLVSFSEVYMNLPNVCDNKMMSCLCRSQLSFTLYTYRVRKIHRGFCSLYPLSLFQWISATKECKFEFVYSCVVRTPFKMAFDWNGKRKPVKRLGQWSAVSIHHTLNTIQSSVSARVGAQKVLLLNSVGCPLCTGNTNLFFHEMAPCSYISRPTVNWTWIKTPIPNKKFSLKYMNGSCKEVIEHGICKQDVEFLTVLMFVSDLLWNVRDLLILWGSLYKFMNEWPLFVRIKLFIITGIWGSFKLVRMELQEQILSMKTAVFWDAAPCSIVDIARRLRGAYCLHHQGGRW